MHVHVYRGPTFAEHQEVFAGWMTRNAVKSNEVFEAKTVENKIDITSQTMHTIPVLFDLFTREAIWVDVTTQPLRNQPINVENTKASDRDVCEAIVRMDNKVSLHDLFKLHADARGTLVKDKEDADIVFSLDGDITPFNIATINSEYMK